MINPSSGSLRGFAWSKVIWIVLYVALLVLPRFVFTRWTGSFSRDTFNAMWDILFLGLFALAFLRGRIVWSNVVLFAVLAYLLVREQVVSVSFWHRVFDAPLQVVLYWMVVLAFLVWSWFRTPVEWTSGTPSEPGAHA